MDSTHASTAELDLWSQTELKKAGLLLDGDRYAAWVLQLCQDRQD